MKKLILILSLIAFTLVVTAQQKQNLYRLTFENKAKWEEVKTSLIGQGETPLHKFEFIVVGHVPYYVKEVVKGDTIQIQKFHEDWAINLYTYEFIDELNQYLVVDEPDKWYNVVQGGVFNIIKKE